MALDNTLDSERVFTTKEAFALVGGLSRTTKMPCHSWGLPAQDCKTGAALATKEGSVCYDCYARKGNYHWPNVQQANERRSNQADHLDWVAAMSTLVDWQAARNKQPYFRWFDTGDLQSRQMLDRIVDVARATPEVQHWLPTKEHRLVKQYLIADEMPGNLTVRLSAHYIDKPGPSGTGLPTSTVHHYEQAVGYDCTANTTKPASCHDCRVCWDPDTPNVSYRYH